MQVSRHSPILETPFLMNSHETFYFRHAGYFPSWATFFTPSLQRTDFYYGHSPYEPRELKSFTSGTENDQKERESDRRPNRSMV